MSSEPCDLDAIALRQMILAGDLSAVDLLDSCFARIESVNSSVNAVVATCYEQARSEAVDADARTGTLPELPPLHGLPILIKDLSETQGLRTTFGSLCFSEHVPDEDSNTVARLRRAGAIVIGKTNTPEFGAGANTVNDVYGATANPFDRSLTCGGSSGGSAVALACGMAPLATGSDFGGSLRIPASFCSVVGIRPSSGLVPSSTRIFGFSPFWTDGPMARSVADAALCLEALTGFDGADPLSSPSSDGFAAQTNRPLDLENLTAGFSNDLGMAPMDNGILKVFKARKSGIGQHFARAVDIAVDFSGASEAFRVLRASEFYASHADRVDEHGDKVGKNVRANIEEARKYALSDVARASDIQTRLYRTFQGLFEYVDVLICPATAVSPFPIDENFPSQVNGAPLEGYFDWYAITWALSLVGCPVVTVPCGTDHSGLPFGIQVAGPRHADAFVIRAAHALEQALSLDGLGRMTPGVEALRAAGA